MNLRSSAFCIGFLALILQILALFAFSHYFIAPKIDKLEKLQVEKTLHRGTEIIQRELYHLEQLTQSLAAQKLIEQLVTNNLVPQTNPTEALQEQMLNYEINLMYILNSDRKVLWESIIDLTNEQSYPKQTFLTSLWNNYPAFLDHSSLMDLQAGIYNSTLGPMLIVSTPVASMVHPQAVQGTLIVGKLITPEFVQLIQSLLYSDLQLWPLGGALLNANQKELIRQLSQGDSDFTIEQRGKLFRGYMAVSDLSEKPNFLLSTIQPREFSTLFENDLLVTGLIILVFQILLIIGLLWLINKMLMRPMFLLTQQFNRVDNSKALSLPGQHTLHEIGLLISAVQGLFSRQEARATREAAHAYREGMTQAQNDIFLRFEENFHFMVESISTLDKKLSNLPTGEIEWIIAESKTRQITPAKLAENIETLQLINEQLRHYQKETRRMLTDLYSKALRNAAVLRARSRNIASPKRTSQISKPISERFFDNATG